MDTIYMEADIIQNGHVVWIIHKTKKSALIAAKFAVKICGAKEARVYQIPQIENLGWYLRLEVEPTPENMQRWIEIAHFKKEVEH